MNALIRKLLGLTDISDGVFASAKWLHDRVHGKNPGVPPPELPPEVESVLRDILPFLPEMIECSPPLFTSSGTEAIDSERYRQISAKGYKSEQDDCYQSGELIRAASAYIAVEDIPCRCHFDPAKDIWPWAPESFKPSDRVRNLTKAGALIAAEIDRLLRAEARKGVSDVR